MNEPQSVSINEDAPLIPTWSMAVAGLSFLLVEYYLWLVLPDGKHEMPLGFRIYFNLSWGVLTALYFLMVGFISKDAPKRGMSSRFWMLLCFVMPGGIGAVLYFLLRAPLTTLCPACSTHVQSDFHFCPQCNHALTASCGKCYRTVRGSDVYCTQCGHELAGDSRMAPLRVVSR